MYYLEQFFRGREVLTENCKRLLSLSNLYYPLSHLALSYGNTSFNSPNKEFFFLKDFLFYF